jgi:uncharacterized protein YcbX
MDSLTLAPGQTIPFDRRWAVVHDASTYDTAAPAWADCANFMIGTRTPALAALWAKVDGDTVTLTHPTLGAITFAPDDPAEAARFLDWISPVCPESRARPRAVTRVPDRGMTDTDYPSVSLLNLASHRAVAMHLGRPDLEPERWRLNIWLDGLDPWAETAWPGRTLRIGTAELAIREPVTRCLHTAANPATGARDADTLGALRALTGQTDLGLYATVTTGGTITPGDTAELLA